MTVFETERLIVRNWTERPDDLARIFGIYSLTEVTRWLGSSSGLPLTEPAQAVAVVRRWHARHAEHAGRYGTWAIERRDTGEVAGTLLLKLLPGVDESVVTSDVEVGWHLHPDSQGHGFATEAARGAVELGFANGAPEIYAVVAPGNHASMAVARRLGMTALGRRTDWYGGEELETFVLPRPEPA